MQYKIPVAAITSAVVVAMLVATPGIIVSSQTAFAAGGLGNPNSNVGGNGNPPSKMLKSGGGPVQTGPANGQGTCYGQGTNGGTGNTQLPNGANAVPGQTASELAQQQKATRDATCPPSPGFPSGH